jgi:hypothetical protein
MQHVPPSYTPSYCSVLLLAELLHAGAGLLVARSFPNIQITLYCIIIQ